MLIAGFLLAHGAQAATPILPTMMKIPQGKVRTNACPDGKPVCSELVFTQRVVDVAAFEMSATEVTFAEWDACVEDNACEAPESGWAYENRPVAAPCVEGSPCQYPADQGWGRGRRPVIDVSWEDVQRYLAWLNAKTGDHYRLPTSAEWEYAALAGATTTFPWGAKLGKNNAVCDGCGSRWDDKQTAPVASFKPNRFGLYDMVGNVAEWVSSCLASRKRGSEECNTYLYRGSSWGTVARNADPRFYQDATGNRRENYIGFRLAR
jgi:formylglycine-generating enzyme required for sulfatase activity